MNSVTGLLGFEFVDVPLPKNQKNPIQFTFLWLDGDRWESKDYEVNAREHQRRRKEAWIIGAERRLKASVRLASDDQSVAMQSIFAFSQTTATSFGMRDQFLEKSKSLTGPAVGKTLILVPLCSRV